jgi:hypothetical protein
MPLLKVIICQSKSNKKKLDDKPSLQFSDYSYGQVQWQITFNT